MTTATATANDYISLEGSFFDFLLSGYYPKPWTGLTMEQVEQVVQDAGDVPDRVLEAMESFRAFLIAAGLDQASEVVLVHNAEKGINVYGPRVLASASGEALIVATGNTSAPVSQDGEILAFGEFKGKLGAFSQEAIDGTRLSVFAKVKTKNGHMFKLPVGIDKELCPTEGRLESIIESGQVLQSICLKQKAGGGYPQHMKELGIGVFLVVGAKYSPKTDTQKYESWALFLADGRKVKAAGNAKKTLEQGYVPTGEKPFVLQILDIEEKGGKTFIKNVLLALPVAERNSVWPAVEAAPAASKDSAPKIDFDDILF